MNYIPLKVTSEYSLLKSTIKIDDLISFLIKNNIKSCAICDSNLYGVMAFYEKMCKHNLKTIIGLEVTINSFNIYLYAKNDQGYFHLLKIHTLKEENQLTFDNLKEHLMDIKIILPFRSFELIDKFPDAFLGFTNDTEKIEACLRSKNTVYYKDARVLEQKDTINLKVLEAIDKGILLSEVTTNYDTNYLKLDVKKEDEDSTYDFIKDIDIRMNIKGNYIPKFNQEVDSFEYLYKLTNKGLKKRCNNNVSPDYQKRLDYELSVIKKMGFVDYFLIVYDYVFYAKKNNILVGPGRGSAAGSLVSYSLGITNIDPLKYDLLFERFLNPERITMPDIDIDFEYTKRAQVIDYVKEKYGKYHVAPIMTFGTLASKQVIRDISRVLNVELETVDRFVSLIDPKLSLKENLNNPKVNTFLKQNKQLNEVYEFAFKLEGLKRHISTHAAGVVICSKALDEVIPISINSETIMTGITMEYLENLGLLKMDFLALRNLTIIANVLNLIEENTGKKLDLNKINLNDEQVFALFSAADTEGVFQYESSGMKNLMLKLKPTTFSDLVASVALFRPGPMQNIDIFINRKYKREKVIYLHPDLEPILKETYGVIVYQEQVMQILVKIGGYTYAQADNIRRAMSKKKESVILEDKNHFLASSISRGYTSIVASAIYDLILKFANYGFNKAHSVSYALIGYQMAYLKVKFPIYFITNLLNMSIDNQQKTKEYIMEAKKKGIDIKKPNINISTNCYKILNQSLLLPLNSIKNLGTNACLSIIKEREENGEFCDYLDFVARTYGKSVNKKTISTLIMAGVLDDFKINRKTMIENLDIAINYASLVSDLDISLVMKPTLESVNEYDDIVLNQEELNAFGFFITNHPSAKFVDSKFIKNNNIATYFNKRIQNVVLVEKIKTIKTKKGDNMAFLSGSDETGLMDFVVFPSVIASISNIQVSDLILIDGIVSKRFDHYQVNVNQLRKIEKS